MGVFDRFPYTNFHELNLDWIMKEIARYDDIITSFQAWQAESEHTTAEIQARLRVLENDMSSFEQDMQLAFNRLSADLQQQINELDAESQRRLTEAINQMQTQINNLIAQTRQQIAEMQHEIDNAIIYLDGRMDYNNQLMREYVEYRLDKFIHDFPSILELPVFNPVRGRVTDIDMALRDLYDMIRVDGAVTAFEYDSLQLTASDYDSLGLTAFQYDTNARYLLKYPDHRWMMISPFTGQWTEIYLVVRSLADLHRLGLTAADYDAKELTAAEYDALGLTAYNYDWHGRELIA